ncbi:MAG: hypothetical protein ACKOPI_07115, partial [bacterium]
MEDVFSALAIPYSVESAVPLRATHTGGMLIDLCRMAKPEAAEEPDLLVRFLRNPGTRARSAEVDELDRRIREGRIRDLGGAEAWWLEHGRRFPDREGDEQPHLDHLHGLRDAADGVTRIAALNAAVRELTFAPRLEEVAGAGGRVAMELRARSAVERAVGSLDQLEAAAVTVADLEALLESISIPIHGSSPVGRVRVTSPYAIRARRFEHVFVCSLQDGAFPRRQPSSPLLTDARRNSAGLPDRSKPLYEERYLFSVCLSRPTNRLYLSWRDLDESGKEVAASPFLDEVRDLLLPEEDTDDDVLFDRIAHRRGLDDVIISIEQAVAETQLARGLAARGRDSGRDSIAMVAGTGEKG